MKKLPMTPDDTFIKIALNTNKEEDTLSEAELNTLTDTIETFSITESDQLNLSAKPDNQTKKENKIYEFANLELIELSCTPNTVYAHKNKNIEILENKHLNKKLHKIEMSDDIQIIEKKDKCTELIKKVDDFLTRKVEVLESKRVLVDRNTGRENLKCVSEPVLCSFELSEKESISCEKESINLEEESNFKFTQSNNDIEILKNSTFNNVEFNEEFNVLEMNQESDTQFYLNKLIEENKSISKHRIKELVYCLQTIFKIERFRTNQLEIINTVLENKDTFVLMPTGGGKSLCYQLPVLLEERVSIVISPLIALIKDQVESLLRLDIPAVAFYGSMKKNDRETCFNLLEEWIEGRGLVKIFYVTPELLNSSTRLENILSKIKVRFVIDEVHCLTQWGNDFRPDYLSLELKKFNAPILCLTATATPSVLKKICENLKITPKIFTQSFLRSNLIYKIKNKSDLKGKSLKDAVIKDIVSFITVYYKDCSGIIYCISKKECEELCSSLNYYNLKTYFYHAGLSSKERESIQTEWSRSNTIMIATIAFGMGINKKDVRFVIHYSIPKNLDCYYQETGRAGRDNLPSECVMYYHYSDRHRIFQMTRSKEVDLVVQLCESDKCRRVKLLEYFNEESKECSLCDICLKKNEKNNKLEYDNKNDKETELILLNYLKNNNGISATKLFKECKISNKIKHSLLRELITKGRIKEKVERNGKYLRTLLYFVK